MKVIAVLLAVLILPYTSHALDTSFPANGDYLCGVTLVQDNDMHSSELKSIEERISNLSGISIADTNQWYFASFKHDGKASLSVLKNYLDERASDVSIEVVKVNGGQTVAFTDDSFWPGRSLMTREQGQIVFITLDEKKNVVRTDRCSKINKIPSHRDRALHYMYHRLPADVILDAAAGGPIGE